MTRNQEKKIKQMIDKWLESKGVSDASREVRSAAWMKYFSELKVPKPVYLLAAATWLCSGAVILPEDMPKVEQAVRVAEINKVDPLRYDRPMAVIEAFPSTELKEAPIDPDTVPTLRLTSRFPCGLAIYDVSESQESREAMRRIINTHFGKEASPWCLLQGDGRGNLTYDSHFYWAHYNAIPKQVAFFNGKLAAFSAMDYPDPEGRGGWMDDEGVVENEPKQDLEQFRVWWDRLDEANKKVIVRGPVKGDRLGRSAKMHIDPNTGKVSYTDIKKEKSGYISFYGSLNDDRPYEMYLMARARPERDVRVLNGVTHIMTDNYRENGTVETVSLPDSVVALSAFSFSSCKNLEKIRFSPNIERIPYSAFSRCFSLAHVELPASIRYVDAEAFLHCPSLTGVAMPYGLLEIGDAAFSGNMSLTGVDIPDTMHSIGSYAFKDCKSLEHAKLPGFLETIHDYTFEGCTGLKEIQWPSAGLLGTISSMAFCSCRSLEEVIIPPSVEWIGTRAFESCGALRRVEIPAKCYVSTGAFLHDDIEEVVVHGTPEMQRFAFEGSVKKAVFDTVLSAEEEAMYRKAFPEDTVFEFRSPDLDVLRSYGVSEGALRELRDTGKTTIKEPLFYRPSSDTSPCPDSARTNAVHAYAVIDGGTVKMMRVDAKEWAPAKAFLAGPRKKAAARQEKGLRKERSLSHIKK